MGSYGQGNKKLKAFLSDPNSSLKTLPYILAMWLQLEWTNLKEKMHFFGAIFFNK